MAITVDSLYKNAPKLYHMKMLAGYEGLNNLVQWVHIIEDDDVSSFLHGHELVFTSGIGGKGEGWLLNFAKKLHKVGTAAFIINIGPYLQQIPQEVINFCDWAKMPLFTIPWETRMVDMTRDFCHRIVKKEQVEDSMATTIKNIIFKVGDLESQVAQMERYGYQRDSGFSFVAMSMESENMRFFSQKMNQLKIYAEKTARSFHGHYISFSYESYYIIALLNYEKDDMSQFVKLIDDFSRLTPEVKVYMGVSPNTLGIDHLSGNFKKALDALAMSKRKKEKVVFYDELGFYKILLNIEDKSMLKLYYDDILGKLIAYDEENSTNLVEFLKVYLEYDASPQMVSEKTFVHRNTVTYQLKKIHKITGRNPMEMEARVQFYICFQIRDIL
ncbi:MAG TPA: PucR family transcriptional regulator ligand-binding domain-containing protein [Lachnospiraceae bacterium]|nr:PucR family transcriptional regulator ligand-binding domain-containing protein [Lachnospiraceae bacterium]